MQAVHFTGKSEVQPKKSDYIRELGGLPLNNNQTFGILLEKQMKSPNITDFNEKMQKGFGNIQNGIHIFCQFWCFDFRGVILAKFGDLILAGLRGRQKAKKYCKIKSCPAPPNQLDVGYQASIAALFAVLCY